MNMDMNNGAFFPDEEVEIPAPPGQDPDDIQMCESFHAKAKESAVEVVSTIFSSLPRGPIEALDTLTNFTTSISLEDFMRAAAEMGYIRGLQHGFNFVKEEIKRRQLQQSRDNEQKKEEA